MHWIPSKKWIRMQEKNHPPLPQPQGRNNYDTRKDQTEPSIFSLSLSLSLSLLSLTIHHSRRLKRNDSYRITVQKSLRSSSDRKLFHRSFIRLHRLIFFTRFDDAARRAESVRGIQKRIIATGPWRPLDAPWNLLSIFIPNCDETNLVCYSLNGNKAPALTKDTSACNSRQTNLDLDRGKLSGVINFILRVHPGNPENFIRYSLYSNDAGIFSARCRWYW